MSLAHCGVFNIHITLWAPTESAVNEISRLYPMYYSSATSPPSRVQFDFWTQVQDPPFIPIKFHLVRFRLLFQPVEIILDLGPVSCLPLCFMSSANLISELSMFWSKSLMERLGSAEARTRPCRSLEIALQVAGDQSVSIHWVLSFIQVPVHWAISSSSPHCSIKSTTTSGAILSNVLLISRSTMLGPPCVYWFRETGYRKSMCTTANIDKWGLYRARFLQKSRDRYSQIYFIHSTRSWLP